MEELLTQYKKLKAQITPNIGCEQSMDEVGWNDSVIESMENLLKDVPKDIAQSIRLGHF